MKEMVGVVPGVPFGFIISEGHQEVLSQWAGQLEGGLLLEFRLCPLILEEK
jgi:hypothetical protein